MKRFILITTVLISGIWLTLVAPAVAQHEHPAGEPEQLGRVNFPISCDAAVQTQFSSAVAMLHSFWYEKAAEAFTAVAEKDATCGMAYLGSGHDALPPDLGSARPKGGGGGGGEGASPGEGFTAA